ncbi:tryptophan-rich sensory protein [hydrocarbon metagenome]|uniref:Tryptophan-rich sensory protein n=1 Tax=hydrocarbon metagenome TaxID=938273 RepID=A0A0W8E3F6_9ZZZZ
MSAFYGRMEASGKGEIGMASLFRVKRTIGWPALIAAVILTLGVGGLSSILTSNTFEAYKALQQPEFAPPGWIFAPVWTLLYIMMGIAAYRIFMYGLDRRSVRAALWVYLLQLVFNFFWTLIFFRWELRGLAFVEILVLLVLIVINTWQFFRIDRLAGFLMVPYILWVAFASVLNFSVWILNII